MRLKLFCTISLNGKIAKSADDSTDWTTKGNKRLFAIETKKAGVIIMGHQTYKAMGRPLPERLNIVMTRDMEGKLSVPGVIEYTNDTPANVVANLEKRKFEEAFVIGGSQINSIFLDAGLINEIWLIVEPIVFGGDFELFTPKITEVKLRLLSIESILSDLLLVKYEVI